MYLPEISVSDYTYNLPVERIAGYPAERRDSSRLLTFVRGNISECPVLQLSEMLPANSTLVFNNSKVIKARMIFKKSSGGEIEIFCLSPVEPSSFGKALAATGKCLWKCVVGNAKRWKSGSLEKEFEHGNAKYTLKAIKIQTDGDWIIGFAWDAPLDFSKVLDYCGNVPIPPYLGRQSEKIDELSYQTVFSKYEGSVAAPTAGLHFSDELLSRLTKRGIAREEITLHVGAGTFRPIKGKYANEHKMHGETFVVERTTLENLRAKVGGIVAVGTTSARMLESLYWLGVMANTRIAPVLRQWDAYRYTTDMTATEAFDRLLTLMYSTGSATLSATTEIMIVPGYRFRTIEGLVTNFHQPGSTLLLLIAALIGNRWKDVYKYALDNNFRFLSYGDCSLLLP